MEQWDVIEYSGRRFVVCEINLGLGMIQPDGKKDVFGRIDLKKKMAAKKNV